MNRLQGVVIWVALASFAAGIGVGMAAPVVASIIGERVDHDERYVDRLSAWCDLRPDQVRDLRAILSAFNDTKRAMNEDERQEWVVQADLVSAQKLMDQRILWILDEEQRKLYREGK